VRTSAVATPMQNVTNSVPRKSTTIGRTLDLPLEASIFSPLVQCPLRAMPGIETPEKGSAGREKWKSAEELWREDGNAREFRPGGEGMRYIQREFCFPSISKEEWREAPGWFWRHHPAACGGTPPQERRG
jgi:hypothetical protein